MEEDRRCDSTAFRSGDAPARRGTIRLLQSCALRGGVEIQYFGSTHVLHWGFASLTHALCLRRSFLYQLQRFIYFLT